MTFLLLPVVTLMSKFCGNFSPIDLLKSLQKEHDKELEEERSHCVKLEQEVGDLIARKEELKTQLRSTEEELADVKESHRSVSVCSWRLVYNFRVAGTSKLMPLVA